MTSIHQIHHDDHRKTNAFLWTVQGLLAALFLFAGGMKLVMPIAALTAQTPLPGTFIRFVGVLELAGALGLVLPGLARIHTELTPLAAAGLVLIMCGATGATLVIGPAAGAIVPILVGALLAIVTYGRWRVAPHQAAPVRTLRAA